MLKTEFKRNIKALLIWSLIFALVMGGVLVLYPYIMKDVGSEMDTLLNNMPKEFLDIFNMNSVSIEKASGWLLTEGYMLITLFGSIYMAILGSSILLREEIDGTIFFLATKPVSRKKIVISKILIGIINILIFNMIISDTIFVALYINNDLILKEWFFMLIGSTTLHIFIFSLSLLISTYVRKNNVALGISLGYIFLSYFIMIVSSLSDKVEFLKYLTPFYYIDGETIITRGSLDIINLIVLIIASIILLIMSNLKYRKKELF